MNSSTDTVWPGVFQSLHQQMPCLSRFCLNAPKEEAQEFPAYLKIAVGAANGLKQKSLGANRLAMIAPRWCEGAAGVAVGAALCATISKAHSMPNINSRPASA